MNGLADVISQENEERWRKTLMSICENIVERAKVGLDAVEGIASEDTPDWFGWMKGNIRALWQEELEVALVVLQCVQSGEEF